MFIADSIAASGNLIKLFMPPASGNLCAINMPEWYSWIRSGIRKLKAASRDKTVETLMNGRKTLNENWDILLKNKARHEKPE